MTQQDDLFEELGRTLEVSPSPDFAAAVRARITRRRTVLRSALSGLAIAASLVLVVVLRTPEVVVVEEVARLAPAPFVPAPMAPTTSATPVAIMPAVSRGSRVVASNRRVTLEEPPESNRLLVVTNQMAILQAAWAGHQASVETEAPAVAPVAAPGLVPIVVEPVRVLPVVIVDHRAPTERLPIIRRAVAALETK